MNLYTDPILPIQADRVRLDERAADPGADLLGLCLESFPTWGFIELPAVGAQYWPYQKGGNHEAVAP